MTAPIEPDVLETSAPGEEVRGPGTTGRTPRQLAWRRLKQDKIALVGGVIVLLLVLIAITAPLLARLEGQDPYTFHQDLIDPTFSTPLSAAGGISGTHWLGVEPGTGRDIFARMVYGAQVSLLIAVGATIVSVVLGTLLGALAGYLGGPTDRAISRSMDVLLAFPLLLFAIAIVAVADRIDRKLLLIIIIGFFSWPYVGRIIRGQTISLREREFIDASRALGAGTGYVIFRELLPNLVAPLIVYSTLIIPTNILFETSLSFLGVGIRVPESSWGQMLNDASQGLFQIDPEYMIVPGVGIFITVLAFNLFGDGLRDALDPRSNR